MLTQGPYRSRGITFKAHFKRFLLGVTILRYCDFFQSGQSPPARSATPELCDLVFSRGMKHRARGANGGYTADGDAGGSARKPSARGCLWLN